MDVATLLRYQDELLHYLSRFDDCFAHAKTRAHLTTYVRGQLSDLDAKSVEPMAVRAGIPARTLQEFLARHRWDEDAVRRRLVHLIRDGHGDALTVGIIDETSDVKKGDKTPGVQRQWCGKVGTNENCLVTVHLAAARQDFHCLVDGELFLPESWDEDRARCREAGIPDDLVHRSKWRIALELLDRNTAEGVTFPWLTADEGYGSKPGFLEGLEQRRQKYVIEVPRTLSLWTTHPAEIHENPSAEREKRGRPRKLPRLADDSPQPQTAQSISENLPDFAAAEWTKYHVKTGEKGPIVWEAKRTRVVLKGSDDLPGPDLWLIVARQVLTGELKYFVSNASPDTPLSLLLLVAFQRWRVESCFEEQKQEIGLDCYEGRRYAGLKRHMILSAVSYYFLADLRRREREAEPDLTIPQLRDGLDAVVKGWSLPFEAQLLLLTEAVRRINYYRSRNAAARKSHTRTTIARFHAMGIDIAQIRRCDWPENS